MRGIADRIDFVDSVSETPGVRLELNDERTWTTRRFSAPPPRLRRAMTSNAMRDGGHVSSSAYDTRTLTLELDLVTEDGDEAAAQLQRLVRELDRPRNLLRYQPADTTRPVFFRTYRSDVTGLEQVVAARSWRDLSIEVLAEPTASGVRVHGSGVVTTAAVGGHELVLPQVHGDVAADLRVDLVAPTYAAGPLFVGSQARPRELPAVGAVRVVDFTTAERSAAVSLAAALAGGWATQQLAATTFSSADPNALVPMVQRIPLPVPAPGDYRLMARVLLTSGQTRPTTPALAAGVHDFAGDVALYGPAGLVKPTPRGSTTYQLVDLGVLSLPYRAALLDEDGFTPREQQVAVAVATGGYTDLTLRIDGLLAVPAGVRGAVSTTGAYVSWAQGGPGARVALTDRGNVVTYDPVGSIAQGVGSRLGSLPRVVPGHRNHLWVAAPSYPTAGLTHDVAWSYEPQYLHIRPVGS